MMNKPNTYALLRKGYLETSKFVSTSIMLKKKRTELEQTKILQVANTMIRPTAEESSEDTIILGAVLRPLMSRPDTMKHNVIH
jgi:hypothetical protein